MVKHLNGYQLKLVTVRIHFRASPIPYLHKCLSKGLPCVTNLFGDDTLILYVVNKPKETAAKLSNNLELISG